MASLNYLRSGPSTATVARPPIVFVHGFGCALSDWEAQVRHFSVRHETIALDLPGHGNSPGSPAEAGIEMFGAAVADLLNQLDLPPAVLVGHSMGCRVIVEAMRAAPGRVAALVQVDGSRFGWAGTPAADRLRETVASEAGYKATLAGMFREMFLAEADPTLVAAIVTRAGRLPHAFGARLLPAMVGYDGAPFEQAFGSIAVPLLAVQSTWTDIERKRHPLRAGQSTPYLDEVRRLVTGAEVEIVENVGHFPQIERAGEVDAMIERFLARHAMV